MLAPAMLALEAGDGLGLFGFIFAGANAIMQGVIYDYDYRPYLLYNLANIAYDAGAKWVTTLVASDRDKPRQLSINMGAKYYGKMRNACMRPDGYQDVEMYSATREDLNDSSYGRSISGSGDFSSGLGGRGSDLESRSGIGG